MSSGEKLDETPSDTQPKMSTTASGLCFSIQKENPSTPAVDFVSPGSRQRTEANFSLSSHREELTLDPELGYDNTETAVDGQK